MKPTRQLITSLCALALAAGCQGAPTSPRDDEGRFSEDRGGKSATVKLNGKVFSIRTRDGKTLGDVGVLVRGKIYRVKDGKLDVPAAVLKDARASGGLILLVPGYLPTRVGLDQGGEVVLVPVGPAQVTQDLLPVGGTVSAHGGAVSVTIPTGVLKGPSTDVAISTYIPSPPGSAQDPAIERDSFLDAVDPAGTRQGCDQPLPCPPPVGGLGIKLTFSGPIQAGLLRQAIALDRYVAEGSPEEAQAARRILQTFEAIDRLNDPAWRRVLDETFGLRLAADHTLEYRVAIGDGEVTDGLARIEIDGVSLLGTRLEVTVQSAASGDFPFEEFTGGPGGTNPGGPAGDPGGATPGGTSTGGGTPSLTPPRELSIGSGWVITTGGNGLPVGRPGLISDGGGTLISDGGGTLISDGGGTLISDGGGTLISDGGGTLISDGGGTLISDGGGTLVSDNRVGALTGELRVPFSQGDAAKYRLLAYQDYPWSGAQVRAINGLGQPYTRFVATDGSSMYQLPFATTPYSLNGMFLQVVAGNNRLYTLAKAPGKFEYTEKIDAATTAVACLLLDEIGRNPDGILAIRKDLFDDDVAYFRQEMDQADAGYVVTHYVPAVATYVRTWLAGKPRKVLACIPSVGPAAGTGAGTMTDGAALGMASFRAPQAIVREGSGAIVVCDEDFMGGTLKPTLRRYDPSAGVVTTLAGDPNGASTGNDGPAGSATFSNLRGVVVDPAGGVLVQDDWSQATTRIRRVAGGMVATLTGPGPALSFAVNPPAANLPMVQEGFGFQRDAAGNLYFVERLGHCVVKLTPDAAGGYTETVLAGMRGQPGNANGSQATARLNSPRDLAVTPDGSAIFVAEWAQDPPLSGGAYLNRIRRIEPAAAGTSRFVTTWAGPDVEASGSADGWGPAARFSLPMRLALGPDGSLYVAENDRLAIRRITPGRMVTTVLGGGTASAPEFGHAVSLKPALKADGTPRDYPIGGMTMEPGAASAPNRLFFTDRYAGALKVLAPLP